MTLCDPVDYSPPGSSVLGILKQEYWSRLPHPPPGVLPDPGIEPVSLTSPALAGGFFTASNIWCKHVCAKEAQVLLINPVVEREFWTSPH